MTIVESATSVLAVDQMRARLYVDRAVHDHLVHEQLPVPVKTSYTLVDD